MISIKVGKEDNLVLESAIRMLGNLYGAIYQQYSMSKKPENVFYIKVSEDNFIQIVYLDNKGHLLVTKTKEQIKELDDVVLVNQLHDAKLNINLKI